MVTQLQIESKALLGRLFTPASTVLLPRKPALGKAQRNPSMDGLMDMMGFGYRLYPSHKIQDISYKL